MISLRPFPRRRHFLSVTIPLLLAAASLVPGRPAVPEAMAAEPTAEATTTATKPAAPVEFVHDSVRLLTDPMPVWALAFSADDRFLVASGGGAFANPNPGLVRVWDFAKSQQIASYSTLRGAYSLAISRDGRRVAWSTCGGGIWLREVGGQELLHETSMPARVAISPDGKLLVAVTERGELRAWDGATGKSAPDFQGDRFPFHWVGFSPDGKTLVATGGKAGNADGPKIATWDVATREQRYQMPAGEQRIPWATISSDGKTLATAGESSITLWDLVTGARRGQTDVANERERISRVEFSPDGKRLAAAFGYENRNNESRNPGTATLFDAATGHVVGKLDGHRFGLRALAFTHDGQTFATGGADRSLRLWNVASGNQTGVLQGPTALPGADDYGTAILAVAYAPDGGSVATAGEDGQVNLYGLSPPGLLRCWSAHTDAAAALAWSPDGKTLVSGGYDKQVKFWDPADGKLIRSLAGHTGWVVSLAVSHDGQTLASGSYDRSIRLWNLADGTERKVLAGHTATVRSLSFSHDDKQLASGSGDHTVRLWNVDSGESLATLTGHKGGVRGVAFLPDDRLLASASEDKQIKLWNVGSHDLRGTLSGHTDIVSGVAFAQNTLVSTSWDHTLRTWNTNTVNAASSDSIDRNAIVALGATPDGLRLATARGDQSLDLWKAKVAEAPPAASPASNRAAHVFRDDFSGKLSPLWKIVREDPSHLSLSANPDRLTITTQKGAIHGDSGNDDESEAAKNIFLIPLPPADESEFRLTLALTRFQPTTYFQQVALLCYDDDDNYVKWSYEYSWAKPATNFVLVRETEMKPEHDLIVELPPPDKLWLRVTKRAADYECAYGTDGKDFKTAGSRPWGKGPPKFVGFMAKNGGNPDAAEIEVQVDSFELASPPSASDKQP